MKTLCSLLVCFLLPISNLSKSNFILSGVVIDNKSLTPIPYANICFLNSRYGIVSDERGYFIWDFPLNKSDTLVVSAIGYKQKLMPISSLLNTKNLEILLYESPYTLPEVLVRKTKESFWIGSKLSEINNIGYGECVNSSFEIVLLVKDNDSRAGVLSKVGYFITDWGRPRTPFRVRLYKNDKGTPGEEIVFGNLIATAKSGGKWFDIDLSFYQIDFPSEGVFVGMEWWLVMQNPKYYYNSQFRYSPEEKTENRRSFGQKLGVTYEYDKPLGWIRRNFKKWVHIWKNPHKKSIANPMIRAEIKI